MVNDMPSWTVCVCKTFGLEQVPGYYESGDGSSQDTSEIAYAFTLQQPHGTAIP